MKQSMWEQSLKRCNLKHVHCSQIRVLTICTFISSYSSVVHQIDLQIHLTIVEASTSMCSRSGNLIACLSSLCKQIIHSKRPTAVFDEHNILDKFQSGFRRLHSTETARPKVSRGLLIQGDAGKSSVSVDLHLSPGFIKKSHGCLSSPLWTRITRLCHEFNSCFYQLT